MMNYNGRNYEDFVKESKKILVKLTASTVKTTKRFLIINIIMVSLSVLFLGLNIITLQFGFSFFLWIFNLGYNVYQYKQNKIKLIKFKKEHDDALKDYDPEKYKQDLRKKKFKKIFSKSKFKSFSL